MARLCICGPCPDNPTVYCVWCPKAPTYYKIQAVGGVVDGTGTGCTGWNGFSIVMTAGYMSNVFCTWASAGLGVVVCPGYSGGYMTWVLFISGYGIAHLGAVATSGGSAYYARYTTRSFNCNGTSILNLYWQSGCCGGWPVTVTVMPL